MTNHDTPLRPSERLRIALIAIASDDDEVTLNRPAAQALVDEVAEIERMAGQAADMVVAARDAADAWHQANDMALRIARADARAWVDRHERIALGWAGAVCAVAMACVITASLLLTGWL